MNNNALKLLAATLIFVAWGAMDYLKIDDGALKGYLMAALVGLGVVHINSSGGSS